ncbi:MAG TPA: hypothetical protein P5146_07665 [Desulfomonilia bacterium]|nr:hypothetical protein [Desulfomonilia bacterium]HRT45572.1 hypothetical protein [Desulfomonilia bacterium]
MNKRHFLSVVLAALLLTGCAAASKQAPALHDDTAFYLARFDKVWDTVITTLKEESIPIDSMDKSRGVIRTKFVNYSVGTQAHHELEKIAEKPSATRLAIWSQAGYTLSILVTPVNDMSTKTRVTAHIEAYDRNVSQQWHECISKGVIESRIIERIRAQL